MREERANFRFLLAVAALLFVAAIVSVGALASLVNAGDSSVADSSSSYDVSAPVNDLPRNNTQAASNAK